MRLFVFILAHLLLWPVFAQAAPISFTAEALLGVDGVTLPNGGPDSISGGSVIYNQPNDNAVLISVPLANVVDNPFDFSVSINLTRLTNDFDPRFYISDGQNLLGLTFEDHDGGSFRAITGSLSGDSRTALETGDESLAMNTGFPGGGGSFDANISFRVSNSTPTISGELLGVSGVSSLSQTLNLSNGLHLLLVSSSNSSPFTSSLENYSFNSLTFDSTPVSAPPVLLLSLLGIIFTGARRHMPNRLSRPGIG